MKLALVRIKSAKKSKLWRRLTWDACVYVDALDSKDDKALADALTRNLYRERSIDPDQKWTC